MNPPFAPEIPYKIEAHGEVRVDPYYWLKERENPRVKEYLEQENRYTEQMLLPTKALHEKLFQEMRGRIKEDDSSVPEKRGEFYYYTRYLKGSEYPKYCRKKGLNANEEVLLDFNALGEKHSYFRVGEVQPNTDHSSVAFAVDKVGRRFYTIYFKDLGTGKILAEEIPNVTGNFVWANDGKTVFYTKQHPETLRKEKVFRHTLGQKEEALVFKEKDLTCDISLSKTKTEKYILITSYGKESSETRTLDADHPFGDSRPFHPREKKHEYWVLHGGDRFYILTNYHAKNFRVMETPLTLTGKRHWKEVVAHNPQRFIIDADVFKNHLVLVEKNETLNHIRIIERNNLTQSHLIPVEDPVYVANLGVNTEYDSALVRYAYQSLHKPERVFDYHMKTKEQVLVKQKSVLSGFKEELYESKRLIASAPDGEKIPLSLVYNRDLLRKDGTNPLLIDGYGAYGYSQLAIFDSNVISLLDRGFIFALAHTRGGSDRGRWWYEEGKLLKKKNTFTDFIACTEYLIHEKYSSPKHTYATGVSAAGLLMGAILNTRPDLYNGVVVKVPFVDALTTMLDPSIPLTTQEYEEWGNPNEKIYYDYIKSYSPYDNVEIKSYPNIFVTAGFHDSQVQYFEPAKWVAKLRRYNKGQNLILLKTSFDAGHSGPSGRFKILEEEAMLYAFLLHLEKMPR